MSAETKRLPWSVVLTPRRIEVTDAYGEHVADLAHFGQGTDARDEARAALIVRAVNSFDAIDAAIATLAERERQFQNARLSADQLGQRGTEPDETRDGIIRAVFESEDRREKAITGVLLAWAETKGAKP